MDTLETIIEEIDMHIEAYEAIDMEYEQDPDEILVGLITIFDD